MQRYRLTKSGVCDCMLPDDNGPWVKYEDAKQAHCVGWEQAKREASHICKEGIPTSWGVTSSLELSNAIAVMEYKEKANES